MGAGKKGDTGYSLLRILGRQWGWREFIRIGVPEKRG